MSVTNDLQQSMLDAMQLLSEKAASNTGATLTVKCTVVEIVDAGLGLYKLQYGNNYFNAYSYLNTVFKEDDLVYVAVPDGDFSQEKMIIGASAPRASMIVPDKESEMFIINPDNILNDNLLINLKSWVNEEKEIENIGISKLDVIFKKYLESGKRDFVFSAVLKTEIDSDHRMKGNYGLILTLPFLEKSLDGGDEYTHTSRDFIMDVNTIPGNPYNYENFSKVNLYFSIKDNLEYDTSIDLEHPENNRITAPKITAFVKDFGYLTDLNKDSDIHFKDIEISMLDILTEEESQGYSLTIISDTGNYFTNGKYARNKILSPILKIKGSTSKIYNWDCYWFVEDSSIDISSDRYFSLGGLGWKCLNDKENVSQDSEGNQTYQYNTTKYTYTVTPDDVRSSLRYKCILVQKETVVSGIIELTNLAYDIDIQLVSATGSSAFLADIGYVDLVARIYYDGITNHSDTTTTVLDTVWQRFDKNDNYIDNDFYTRRKHNEIKIINGKTYLETEIIYPCTKLDEINTVHCTFYSKDIEKDAQNKDILITRNLGTRSIVVSSTTGLIYGLAIQGGDLVYKYDADGDSPVVADYDGPLSSQIKTIEPISYKVFKSDGTELTDTEYKYCYYEWMFPKNSMMKLKGYSLDDKLQEDGYYHITGYGISSINYEISDTYNKKKNNNSILLKVVFDGIEITDSVTPKFLKDGEGGTNGSKYTAILSYKGYGYGERDGYGRVRKLQAAYAATAIDPNTPGWKIYNIIDNVREEKLIDFNEPKIDLVLYRDGRKIEDDSLYSVSWSMFDNMVVNPCFSVSDGILKNKVKKVKDENEEEYEEVTVNWDDSSKVYCNIIQATVTIKENSITNSQEVLYAYYPIEITWLKKLENVGVIIPNLDGGFEEVVYASDGTNPQYDNTNNFACIDNLYTDDSKNYYIYDWSTSSHLKISGTQENTADIKPTTRFDDGDSKNYVKVALTLGPEQRNKISVDINTYTQEKNKIQNRIYFYEHDKEKLDKFLKNFDYDNYIKELDKSKKLLALRNDMLINIKNLLTQLENFNNYCKEKNIDISIFNWNKIYSDYYNDAENAYRYLYLLGSNNSLNDIYNLSYNIIEFDTNKISSNYGAGISSELSNLVQTYNSIIKLYNNNYVKITSKENGQFILQQEYEDYKILVENILNLSTEDNLKYLATAHDTYDPDQEFVNLQSQIAAVAARLTDVNESITNYASFVENILKVINTLLSVYKDTEYQNEFYCNNIDIQNELLLAVKNKIATLSAALLPNEVNEIVHIKPIIMLFNRYEMANLNNWDGNKLYIDEKNNEYLLAPQVGAGAKKNGRFTGVLMGVKQFQKKDKEQRIGLIGYAEGIQSFYINSEDGSAIMGKAGKGQILIDPSADQEGRIYSGNFYKEMDQDGKPRTYNKSNEAGEGMLINLTLPEIRFGSGDFSVNQEGYIRAAGGGWIGGWKINDTELYSDVTKANGRITLDSGTTILPGYYYDIIKDDEIILGENFSIIIYCDKTNSNYSIKFVKYKDKIYKVKTYNDTSITIITQEASSTISEITKILEGRESLDNLNTYINGKPIIDKYSSNKEGTNDNDTNFGKIYSHSHSSLTCNKENENTKGFYLSADGLSIGAKVRITSDGVAYFGKGATKNNSTKHWTINGSDSSDYSYIAYNTSEFSSHNLDNVEGYSIGGGSDQVYLGTNGIRLGNKFAVDSDGNIVARHIIAKQGGNIAGWTIKPTTLEAENIIIDSGGQIWTRGFSDGGTGWRIDSDGKAYFNWIKASNGGEIGGWGIDKTKLYAPGNGGSTNSTRGLLKADSSSNKIIILDGAAGTITCNVNGGSITMSGSGLLGVNNGAGFKLDGTGLSFTSGGTAITAGSGALGGSTALTGKSTTVDGEKLPTYIEKLIVEYLRAKTVDIFDLHVDSIVFQGQALTIDGNGHVVVGTI